MFVRLRIDERDPPTGTVVLLHSEVPFVGWLGLLRALSDLLVGARRNDRGQIDGGNESDHSMK
jgi:hypothetical protein